jgi:hypothetical protein
VGVLVSSAIAGVVPWWSRLQPEQSAERAATERETEKCSRTELLRYNILGTIQGPQVRRLAVDLPQDM